MFERVPTFCSRTGKHNGFRLEPVKYICDFSGDEIDMDDPQFRPFYDLEFDYCSASEEDWYYDRIDKLVDAINGYHLTPYDEGSVSEYHLRRVIAETSFHYSLSEDARTDASLLLFKEFAKAKTKKHYLYGCRHVGEVMRRHRLKLVISLLKKKLYSPEELGLIIVD